MELFRFKRIIVIIGNQAYGGTVVLGVDPGSHRCGWAVVRGGPGAYSALDYGCLTPPAHCPAGERMEYIHSQLGEIIAKYQPTELSIEKLFFNRNVTSCILVAEARGVVMLAAQQAGLSIHEYMPADIKKALTGTGRATKAEVTLMVMAYLGLTEKPKPDDTADALGIAITRLSGRLFA